MTEIKIVNRNDPSVKKLYATATENYNQNARVQETIRWTRKLGSRIHLCMALSIGLLFTAIPLGSIQGARLVYVCSMLLIPFPMIYCSFLFKQAKKYRETRKTIYEACCPTQLRFFRAIDGKKILSCCGQPYGDGQFEVTLTVENPYADREKKAKKQKSKAITSTYIFNFDEQSKGLSLVLDVGKGVVYYTNIP